MKTQHLILIGGAIAAFFLLKGKNEIHFNTPASPNSIVQDVSYQVVPNIENITPSQYPQDVLDFMTAHAGLTPWQYYGVPRDLPWGSMSGGAVNDSNGFILPYIGANR